MQKRKGKKKVDNTPDKTLKEFVDGLSTGSLETLKKIVKVLHHKYELSGERSFQMPRQTLRKEGISREERLYLIKRLHQAGVIKVFSGKTSVLQNPDIVFGPTTVVQIKDPKFFKKSSSFVQKANRREGAKILVCGNLSIDFEKVILRYKKNKLKEIVISPSTREIKLLTLLLDRRETVVTYRELAKAVDLPTYREDDLTKNYSRDIQSIKKDLATKILKKAGMSKEDINKMIKTTTKIGYILHC